MGAQNAGPLREGPSGHQARPSAVPTARGTARLGPTLADERAASGRAGRMSGEADRVARAPSLGELDNERARTFRAPPLTGRHVALRAPTPGDYERLQALETSSELAPQWRLRGATPSPQDWMQGAWRGVLAQFLVLPRGKGSNPVGLVVVYQANFQDGFAYVAATTLEPRRRSPLLMLGFGVFLNYVFRCWNFRKLYMEVPAYNFTQFASGVDRYFTVEGRLRDRMFLDGQYWDQYVLAIDRARWEEQGAQLMRAEAIV